MIQKGEELILLGIRQRFEIVQHQQDTAVCE